MLNYDILLIMGIDTSIYYKPNDWISSEGEHESLSTLYGKEKSFQFIFK